MKKLNFLSFEKLLKFVLIGFVFVAIALAVLNEYSAPRIKKVIEPNLIENGFEQYLEIKFSKKVDRSSLEKNLKMMPDLELDFFWKGESVLLKPIDGWQLNQKYLFEFDEQITDQDKRFNLAKTLIEFETPEAFVGFIKTDQEGVSQIVLANLQGEVLESLLTEEKFLIKKFEFLTQSEKIVFLAKNLNDDLPADQLYLFDLKTKKLIKLTVDEFYVNQDFNISRTGKYLILSRILTNQTGEYLSKNQLWLIDLSNNFNALEPRLLKDFFGSKALFSKDDSYLLGLNSEDEYYLLNLAEGDLQLVGSFRMAWDFHPSRALLVLEKFVGNDLFKSVIYLFDGNGENKELDLSLVSIGENFIVNHLEFSANGQLLWLLLDQKLGQEINLNEGKSFIYSYDLKNGNFEEILQSEVESYDYADFSLDSRMIALEKISKFANDVLSSKYRNLQLDLNGRFAGVDLRVYDLKNKKWYNFADQGYNLRFFYR